MHTVNHLRAMDSKGHALDGRIRVLRAWIDVTYEPRRHEVGEADRPENKLGFCELSLVR